MIERQVDLTTPDGTMPTFLFHPEHDGPHPVVLYLMDAPGIRPALRDMASRLGTAGYYVMLPYLYYRGGPYREFTLSDEDMHARTRADGHGHADEHRRRRRGDARPRRRRRRRLAAATSARSASA